MKTLTLFLALFASILTGCLESNTGRYACPPPAYTIEFWTRNLEISETHSLFSDARRPLDPAFDDDGYGGIYEVYFKDPYENNAGNAKTVPRKIFLSLLARYTTEAARNWETDGLFAKDSSDWSAVQRAYLYHELRFDLDSMPLGTYTFHSSDTTGKASVRVWMQVGGDSLHTLPPLALTSLSGSITILKTFTKSSGSFSYSVEAEYLPGQSGSFHGTVTFNGTTHAKACSNLVD